MKRILIFLCLVFCLKNPVIAVEAQKTLQANCGICSVYFATRLIGMPIDLDQIIKALGKKDDKGVAIIEIEDFLRSKNLHTDIRWLSPKEFSKTVGDVAIVLMMSPDKVEPGHYVVARAIGNSKIQFIDSKSAPSIVTTAENLTVKLPVIRIFKQRKIFGRSVKIGLTLALMACGILYFFRRKSLENT